MKSITEAIVELLKVKSIITLAIVGALVYLAVTGVVEIAIFTSVASSVLTYYFTKRGKDEEKTTLEQVKQSLKEKENKLIDENREVIVDERVEAPMVPGMVREQEGLSKE